ncbi:pyrimidine/purine nucleoside phosphorylase [Marinihelvus fidelis]|uniref:Pyrimidine/purine nucleoside phosphorylase n=1 Tax=Marinihelvus fidelis TaxID=2613842 RepID=A0A5N0TC23_9GAMM|nr:pyrimidine/purine nucleoside phosphorylase [Marinihelvus fidelis]KAA9130889.1 pyrimidine/purine nucleoside phosphorylase [Marinihelvus fidelis]
MKNLTSVILETGDDGRARIVERPVDLPGGHEQLRLSDIQPTRGMQWRESPVGYHSAVHCSGEPQWVFILSGQMEIGLPGGERRVFSAGEHFFSNDTLPEGATFDSEVHGHWSRQVGELPLVTLFIKALPS